MDLNSFAKEHGIKLIMLFGSRARGTEGANSDADIAVLANRELSLGEQSVLVERLCAVVKTPEDKIDLVDLWNASPLLQHQVGEEGKLLYGDPFDFIRFRVLAWKRYQNTAKFRRARHETLKEYVQGND